MNRRLHLIYSLFLVISFTQVYGQGRIISGTVVSGTDGEPLPGVNVLLKGTSVGTVTNTEGVYQISVPAQGGQLIFSFIGYATQEVDIGSRSVIDMALEEDVKQLGEVVVVGFGSLLKTDLTGSIAKVEGKSIEGIPVPSFESAIQGRTAGVYISSGSGKPGQGIKMRIRGSSSVTASNEPLYVVDGIPITSQSVGIGNNEPTNPLADINFNDIESIEILKDASAAAIYGSRASNGVVLITTKRGDAGATQINFNYSRGFSEPTNKKEWLNAEEYIELFTESVINSARLEYASQDPGNPVYASEQEAIDYWLNDPNDGLYPFFDYLSRGLDWQNGEVDTDWQDQAFQSGMVQNFDVSANGGSDKTRFYTSLAYHDMEGILIGTAFSRLSGRLNVDHDASERLRIGLNLGLSHSQNERVANDNAFATPLQMVAQPPIAPTRDPETGELIAFPLYYSGLVEQENSDFVTSVFRNLSNLYASYELIPGLTFRSEFGLDLLDQLEEGYQGRKTQTGGPDGLAQYRTVRVTNYNLNNFLTFNKNLSDRHSLDITAGVSYQNWLFQDATLQARGFPNDNFKKIASAADIVFGSSFESEWSLLSYFARANYKLSDKYLLTLSGRFDGSSRFGKDNQFGFFPAASIGWILSEESFLEGSNTISFLKLRASYGETGNSEISNFASRGLYEGTSYGGISGMRPITVENPELKWETTQQVDIGFDFGFFNDRITGEADFYVKNTRDLLLDVRIPSYSGYTTITRNIGKLNNKGFELTLHTENLTGAFRWNTSFNIAHNKNKISDLDGQVITADVNRAVEGHPIGVFYMRKYAGVDPANGDALYYLSDSTDELTNNYNAAQQQVVGDPNPDFVGGLNNTFSYKGFDLSIFYQFVEGADVFNDGGKYQSVNADYYDNQTRDQLARWREPGDQTDVPQARFGFSNGTRQSSRWLEDGSYGRLKTVTIGYTFSRELLNRIGLRSARVYATGQNLLTFTQYSGWDPEVNFAETSPTSQRSNLRQGVDFYTAPQPRTIIFGVSLGI